MKNKAIMSLILIAVMVISTTIAFANSFTNNSGSLGSNGWTTTTTGQFGGSFGIGVYSTVTGQGYSRAVHPMNLNSSGTHAFDARFRFKLNNVSEGIWLGVANSGSGATTGNQLVVGYPGYGSFVTSVDGTANTTQAMSPSATPTRDNEYIAHITSNDGYSITFTIESTTQSVVAGPVTRTMPSNGRAAYLVLQINNRGPISGSPSATNNPMVNQVIFQDQGGSSTPSPTTTPTNNTTPTATPTSSSLAASLQGIRDYYASQPVVHMSNQSVVYNPDGTIKQVITGNQTNATPTASPVATVKANVTASPTVPANVTATAVPSTPAPTKAKSPGFEIILAAIGMIAALALVRVKK